MTFEAGRCSGEQPMSFVQRCQGNYTLRWQWRAARSLATWDVNCFTCEGIKHRYPIELEPCSTLSFFFSMLFVFYKLCHFSFIVFLSFNKYEYNEEPAFCLTVHHQLGKVILMNQLDATMIYWSIRSAQHVSGNILPIIRSVKLRYLQHMVSCCCGG